MPYKKTDLLHQMGSLPSALPGPLPARQRAGVRRHLPGLPQEPALRGAGAAAPRSQEIYAALRARRPSACRRAATGSSSCRGSTASARRWRIGWCAAAFFNQSLQTTRGHLVRAVMEGVAYNSRWLFGYVERFVGRQLEPIRIIGGGARSKLWCQIYADVLGRPIQQVDEPVHGQRAGSGVPGGAGAGAPHGGGDPRAGPRGPHLRAGRDATAGSTTSCSASSSPSTRPTSPSSRGSTGPARPEAREGPG